MLKRIINTIVWVVVSLYIILIILLHLPSIQGLMGSWTSDVLSKKLGTTVSIGRIDLGFANRLIVDDICILDQKDKKMLKASRASIKINILPLIRKRISVSSVQLFGMKANLYKETSESKMNYQFLVDSLSNKNNTTKAQTDLQINSLIIRHGEIKYRCLSEKMKSTVFSTNNIDVRNISAHIILDKYSNDSINIKVKKLSFEEQSGIKLKKLTFKLIANKKHMAVSDFNIELPASKLHVDSIDASYVFKDQELYIPSLKFNGSISDSYLTPSDLSFCLPKLNNINYKIRCNADIYGLGKDIYINNISVREISNLFAINTNIHIRKYSSFLNWYINRFVFKTNGNNIKAICEKLPNVKIPEILFRLGEIEISGESKSIDKRLYLAGSVQTELGTIAIDIMHKKDATNGHITANEINIGKLTDDSRFGVINAKTDFKALNPSKIEFKGDISSIDYNQYTYQSLMIDGTYDNGKIGGNVELNDPNAQIKLTGNAIFHNGIKIHDLVANIKHLSPSALHLSNKWPNAIFNMTLSADIEGRTISDATGHLRISDFSMISPQTIYKIDSLYINAKHVGAKKHVTVSSDFCDIAMFGNINYKTIPQSVIGLIQSKLPTIPWNANMNVKRNNDFELNATIYDSKWINVLLGFPIELHEPMKLNAWICDKNNDLYIDCQIPSFIYDTTRYKDALIHVNTIDGILKTSAQIKKLYNDGKIFSCALNAVAADNELGTEISINENENNSLKGKIKANTIFYKNAEGNATADINIKESNISIEDTVWHIKPSNIIYNKNYVAINDFSLGHDGQNISVTGKATKNASDSIQVNLKDININYILDMVNFHSVEFDGFASGAAYIKGISSNEPNIYTDLTIKDFKFENGRMGTLNAHAEYNNTEKQIDIHALATDSVDRKTLITGYVSPMRNYIDLNINAHNTRIKFMESFCSSFMRDVNAHANGAVRLSGPLNNINLTGQLVANGTLGISSLNSVYTLRNDTIRFIPDKIEFKNDSIFDNKGNHGIVEGEIHHEHLTNLSYDLFIACNNLLTFNTADNNDGSSFYGTVYATGDCQIKGRSGEVTMDINVSPEENSVIVYDVSSQNDISTNEFIQWKSLSKEKDVSETHPDSINDGDFADNNLQTTSDIRLNFLVDCNPALTIKVLMDRQSGDYVSLNGNGTLRASYYNKGAFDLFGNYIVDHGVYKLTIRDIIKKEFTFQRGGTIKFVGDPYNASLDLKAIYVLNGVSLSDLNIGNSFSNNNVRVNCLMNVTGTPNSPKVSFDLDMPTLSSDAKQMVASVINAEEEMNQQVLYLLTVGRFYTQNNNNNSTTGTYSQASLAMQSILSGTISQQLNNLLGNIINNNNWNFGANISTGTEGFNDAEYEGILSGKLLNNRLLINGQFGYRDNANATTSFIGDFDLRYLLFPNGNLSINVYNKTNDRYFTKNSLNTQGIGIIMKKDFNGIKDFFRKKK